ncbi:argininosuccinate synthase [Candidatus Bathyarchaeota archaeon B24-2]|nr:MAG: argininosuccinate synthase [Candidatus Bathyarchaeota archaeon B24-2]
MKTVLAYSGGLDTSVCIKWIQEKYDSEVITLTVDVGQKRNFKLIEERAKKLGVLKHYYIDAKEEFVLNYVFPAIKANAMYEGVYPLSSALSRPLIASKLVEIAEKEGASAVAHGCTGKGNDQVRFEVTIHALNPELKVIAPVREWNLNREDEVKYLKESGLDIEIEQGGVYSIDQNLWGRSIEGGVLEHPDVEPPEDIYEWTSPIEKTPQEPQYVKIGFSKGVPTQIDGESMKPVELIRELNVIAGRHGIGRIEHLEDRLVGIKSREVYECPAALVLLKAHKDLEKSILTRHELEFKSLVDDEWSRLVYFGLWMDPLKEDLEAFINSTQERVSGEVKLKLYKGNAVVVGRSSKNMLYDLNLATYGLESTFNQKASEGFIELWGLQTKLARKIASRELENV